MRAIDRAARAFKRRETDARWRPFAGVSDALENGYLRSVMFVVTRPKGGGSKEVETVEEYRFSVKHGDRGEVALDEVQHVGPGGGVSVGLS